MCRDFLKSSIGRKMVVAVTGLFLWGFVVVHMLGNLQIFLGQEALNAYAHKLQSLPLLLWPARAFLLAVFIVHLWFSLRLAVENRRARPIGYAKKDTVQASAASRTMALSGMILLAFVIYHLLHFTFGVTNPDFFNRTDAKGWHDVYAMSVLSFQNYFITGSYVVAMFFMCFHLSHGLASLPQSLGLSDEKWKARFKILGNVIALAVFIGNSSIPLSVLFGIIKLPLGR